MTRLLLPLIYLAFISLGLPDALLGTAWPVMRLDLDAPLDMAGWLFMTIAAGTIVSSLFSGRLIERYSTGPITAASAGLTALALIGFFVAPSLIWLFVLAIPLGLGAGVVDAALNHFVATHYQAHHMNWLHCFWGIGATAGPLIMAGVLLDSGWRLGYLVVGALQLVLMIVLIVSLPLWKRAPKQVSEQVQTVNTSSGKPRGLVAALAAFCFYCGAEAVVGLWGSSYLVQVRSFSVTSAATWISVYYGSITAGRFISGFLSLRWSNRRLIRVGQWTAFVGAACFILAPAAWMPLGFVLVGLGLAPIYPAMLHETPVRFGEAAAQRLMGVQMAFAYTGSTFMPPLFGWLATSYSLSLFHWFTISLIFLMLVATEGLNRMLFRQRLAKAS
ncbi:MFS transporter [Exiguobacterium sp. TBG-PICH-001]|uniref:MFS transporter n=1 Tax=Exiguobacterium abrahamii TaxID=2785532 RepID=UPI0018A6D5FC|nr:MFS transporter [Exiguobacterium sp. TBG-PICH-001]MBF8153025.1 MFS transporter [Exiguobacterium sp. TBG-PICH-001]